MNVSEVIIRPIITEKSLDEVQKGRYTFEVAKEANKEDIKKAVKVSYGVGVVGVKTMINKGGTRRVGKKKIEVKEKSWKKAVVQLGKDQKISAFEVGAEKTRSN